MTFTVLLTPEDAEQLLKRNINNRELSRNTCNKYYHALKDDKLDVTSDIITFGSDGNCSNGQHRLTSIAKGDKSVLVIIGCNIDFSPNQDRGRARKICDNIKMVSDRYDIKDPVLYNMFFVSGIGRILRLFHRDASDVNEYIAFIKNYYDVLVKCGNDVINNSYNSKGCKSSSFIAASILWCLAGYDTSNINDIQSLLCKEYLPEMDKDKITSIMNIRDRILVDSAADNRNADAYMMEMFTVIWAFNHGIYKIPTRIYKNNKLNEKYFKLEFRAIREFVSRVQYKDAKATFKSRILYNSEIAKAEK